MASQGVLPSSSSTQPEAGPSSSPAGLTTTAPRNPQLGPDPWFTYPTPTPEQIEEELPPYFEDENVPLGLLLDRLTRKTYSDMRHLVEKTLPASTARQKPKHIIEFAKTTRHAALKYLAVLRWKMNVDVPLFAPPQSSFTTIGPSASFPTPHSSGESNGNGDNSSPGSYSIKGKGKLVNEEPRVIRGKVTDAKRITHLLEHQNRQHEEAVAHLKYSVAMVDSLRVRNADVLTAVALASSGTYTRLPSSLTQEFQLRKSLTNKTIVDTLQALNTHIRFRLRCIDYLPPEIKVDRVQNGKAYISGGGKIGWKAEMTIWGFGEGQETRWWLTGVEWVWRSKGKGVDDPGGSGRLTPEGRQQVMEMVNSRVLPPRPVRQGETKGGEEEEDRGKMVDAPLIRLHNVLQHLSLSYQMEVLFMQAMALSQGKRRGHLLVEIDRPRKELRLRYWPRPRPHVPIPTKTTAVGKRSLASAAVANVKARQPYVGGVITIGLDESPPSVDEKVMSMLGSFRTIGMNAKERVLNLRLSIKWEIGEAGTGGPLRLGDRMNTSSIIPDPANLDVEDIIGEITRRHASAKSRHIVTPILAIPRVASLTPPPVIHENPDTTSARPLVLQVPIPSQQRHSISIGVSSITGMVEVQDSGAKRGDARSARVNEVTVGANNGKGKLGPDLIRLIIALAIEAVEDQMRQMGWGPIRRLGLPSQEISQTDLHPSTTVFVPVPSSPLHFLAAKTNPQGIFFELIRQSDKAVPTISGFHITNRDLKDVFIFANALVAQTIIEQQLKDRSIPYNAQYPASAGEGAPTSKSTVAGMIPIFSVSAAELLRSGPAADVAMPKVFIQIKDWWKGTRCGAVTAVQLRHRSAVSGAAGSPGLVGAAAVAAGKSEDITFDQASSVVQFHASDIRNCVVNFLEQWERLSKVIVVAGEVHRLKKESPFSDLRLLSFDLRTATFIYTPGFCASITYDPMGDTYETSFSRLNTASSTPATMAGITPASNPAGVDANPHEKLAPLLSYYLNQLVVKRGTAFGVGSAGRRFIGLLKATLPLLLEVEVLKQSFDVQLVVSGVRDYRLVWDVNDKRYAIDITLTAEHNRFIITDASLSSDGSCGPITPLPKIDAIVITVHSVLREAKMIEGKLGKRLMRLDSGKSLVCEVPCVSEVIRLFVSEVTCMLRGL
ncbi:hypothetical protein TREMEDRAFT_37169 [Tremella mesenterica DSM 1558]|uniref:uncharacterized protein n=1 Tax=Tremella mesenterica (strain ATCC 24925 / CBS 8224 / DSM 1558 / NBRC 9311 / NRRL Y-6157 / RJB 2259-6 / UBC 559-6) TaxID=578456 RepID=UPI0003F49FB8|nr:uncharacterized protein TREMEDRAFT_37169 [Tremella mesenterica DSM 1558]EIW73135.1 hypothetical protein TREMEDRAFT_37169 [Tremella mesenterica DSM 1558]